MGSSAAGELGHLGIVERRPEQPEIQLRQVECGHVASLLGCTLPTARPALMAGGAPELELIDSCVADEVMGRRVVILEEFSSSAVDAGLIPGRDESFLAGGRVPASV